VQLRFLNHLCLQAVSLAIGWQLNQRTCKGWQVCETTFNWPVASAH